MPGTRFGRTGEGDVRLELPADEMALLTQVAGELAELLDDALPDEARDRLFPLAYDDPDLEAEYRRLTARDLEDRKRADLATMRATLGRDRPLILSPEEAGAWLGALQDMRLTIGAMLGIEKDGWEDQEDETDPQVAMLRYLGYLQDALIQLLM